MSALSRAHRMGADARAATIAAWLRTLIDWNVSLERAAEMIEAGVPWGDSEQSPRENLTEAEFRLCLPDAGNEKRTIARLRGGEMSCPMCCGPVDDDGMTLAATVGQNDE